MSLVSNKSQPQTETRQSSITGSYHKIARGTNPYLKNQIQQNKINCYPKVNGHQNPYQYEMVIKTEKPTSFASPLSLPACDESPSDCSSQGTGTCINQTPGRSFHPSEETSPLIPGLYHNKTNEAETRIKKVSSATRTNAIIPDSFIPSSCDEVYTNKEQGRDDLNKKEVMICNSIEKIKGMESYNTDDTQRDKEEHHLEQMQHQLSENRKEVYNQAMKVGTVIPMVMDGNCFVRAVAQFMYNDVEKHAIVRRQLVEIIERNWECGEIQLRDFVEDNKTKQQVFARICLDGQWLGDMALHALVLLLKKPVYLWDDSMDYPMPLRYPHIQGFSHEDENERVCHLHRTKRNHYELFIPRNQIEAGKLSDQCI